MPLLVTDAIVLHSFDYLESSRIYRLATREAGLQAVLARGARNSRVRFGSAMGSFAEGVAQISMKDGRDLHTLDSFDVTDARGGLAADYARFLGASVVAELFLRFSSTEASSELFETLREALDAIGAAQPDHARLVTLAVAWRIVADLGFGPSLAECASCHATVEGADEVVFGHRAGGVLCERCSRGSPAGRRLPRRARAQLQQLLDGGGYESVPGDSELRAHARLLREFVAEHLADERPLSAFAFWEQLRQ
jgi:DNA repair protein RecO (recombination protein O)